MLRIGIVTGEPSGDNLGAALIQSIKKKYPDVVIEGIGGEKLTSQGCNSLYDMERLSVIGIFEILGRYFELLGMQRSIKKYFMQHPPDVFIGIDSPDFTLSIEKTLRKEGIKTVHYVSPSVWAWREHRLKTIAKSTDLMLILFPFEEHYYKKNDIPVKFVGHPLANEIPLINDHIAARKELNLDAGKYTVALLPGSRPGEISRLTEPFLNACKICHKKQSNLRFICGLRDQRASNLFLSIKEKIAPELKVELYVGKTRSVLAAADCVLLASGTATFETLLMKRPMVVAYKANWFTYKLIMSLLKVPYVSLPNLLAGERLVAELLQNDCEPEKLAASLFEFINDENKSHELITRFTEIHKTLIHDDQNSAGNAVLNLLEKK